MRTPPPRPEGPALRLGVSACLVGERVRHDGGHKHASYLTDVLGSFVEWVPVCPEVELGLGVPRPTLRLEGSLNAPRLVEPESGRDRTRAMQRYTARRTRALAAESLHGFVLKSRSPSCGLAGLPVYHPGGRPVRRGRGTFADALVRHCPLLPVVEEHRLRTRAERAHFVEQVFAYRRWTRLLSRRPSRGALATFHAHHTLALRSHGLTHAARLEMVFTRAQTLPPRRAVSLYGDAFMHVMHYRATRAKHTVVLRQLGTALAPTLSRWERDRLTQRIEAYRGGHVPLAKPIALITRALERHGADWALQQSYLTPGPIERALRDCG